MLKIPDKTQSPVLEGSVLGNTTDPHLQESSAGRMLLAFIVEGASPMWDINVLQVLAKPATSTRIAVDGRGVIEPTGYLITRDQARDLAIQINELLGRETRCQ